MMKYEGFLENHKRLSFDRIGYLAVERIEMESEKLSYIDYLIVDEFQDINLNQYKLVEMIGWDSNVFVVGDPRQSIYQWRGSNERFFLDFDQNFQDAQLIQIRTTGEVQRRLSEYPMNLQIVSNIEITNISKQNGMRSELFRNSSFPILKMKPGLSLSKYKIQWMKEDVNSRISGY